jgi:hypothetical protein
MKVGGDSRQVLTYLSSIYAPIVTYCGETKIERKYPPGQIELIRRWLIRQTWSSPTAESPRISCDDATAECEISEIRDFTR